MLGGSGYPIPSGAGQLWSVAERIFWDGSERGLPPALGRPGMTVVFTDVPAKRWAPPSSWSGGCLHKRAYDPKWAFR